MAMTETIPVPTPVMGLYDRPMWASIASRRMALQKCSHCGLVRYPPGPICARCLSEEAEWTPLSGKGTILSWVVFHKHYLPAYPPPYNVVAVRLDEGPVMMSNLVGATPSGSWRGQRVAMQYEETDGGPILPRFALTRLSSGG
jgi:uncharacterized OB-fold protein